MKQKQPFELSWFSRNYKMLKKLRTIAKYCKGTNLKQISQISIPAKPTKIKFTAETNYWNEETLSLQVLIHLRKVIK